MIPPALTPEEWAAILARADVDVPLGLTGNLRVQTDDRGSVWLAEGERRSQSDVEVRPDQAPAVIAALNAALSDTDPRKITQEKLASLFLVIQVIGCNMHHGHLSNLQNIADAIMSYLPTDSRPTIPPATDTVLADDIHVAEANLNAALRAASARGLDAEATIVDASVLGSGRCVMVRASVRRPL